MLSPIPARILRSTAVFSVPIGIDRYQRPTVETFTVSNVHCQSDNTTRKTTQNTEVSLRGILFIDARRSVPALDFNALQEAAQAAGGVMSVVVTGRDGRSSPQYTVLTVDALPDDEDRLHHWELGLT